MGLGPRFSRSVSDGYVPQTGNPNPNYYRVLHTHEEGKGKNTYCILELQYPDCTNYEGKKILVFECSIADILKQKIIDPHFSRNTQYKHPIARFQPNIAGWMDAVNFVKMRLKLVSL